MFQDPTIIDFLKSVDYQFDVNVIFRQTSVKLITDRPIPPVSLEWAQKKQRKLKITYPEFDWGMNMQGCLGWALLDKDRDLRKQETGKPGPLRVFHEAYIHLYSEGGKKWKEPVLIDETNVVKYIMWLSIDPESWGKSIVEVHYFQQEEAVPTLDQLANFAAAVVSHPEGGKGLFGSK